MPVWDLAYGDGTIWAVSFAFEKGYHLPEISTADNRVERDVVVDPNDFMYLAGTVESLLVVGGDVYFAHGADGCPRAITKIDASTGALLRTLNVGQCNEVSQLAWSDGMLVAGQPYTVTFIDPKTGMPEHIVEFPRGFEMRSLVVLGGRVWVTGAGATDGELLEIDPDSGTIVGRFADGALAVTALGNELWIVAFKPDLSGFPSASDTHFQQVDPSSGRVIATLTEPVLSPGYWATLRAEDNELVLESQGPDSSLALVRP